MDKDEVISQLERSIQRLCEDHPEVKEAILFGSLARGDHGTRSDADSRTAPLTIPEALRRVRSGSESE